MEVPLTGQAISSGQGSVVVETGARVVLGGQEIGSSQGAVQVTPPIVTVDPTPQTEIEYRLVTFTGLATTITAPLTYDWYSVEDGLVSANAGGTYSFWSSTPDNGKNYYFIAIDAGGNSSAPSASALLTLTTSACLPCPPYTCDAQLDYFTLSGATYVWPMNDKVTGQNINPLEIVQGVSVMNAGGTAVHVGETATTVVDSCAGVTSWTVRPGGAVSNTGSLWLFAQPSTDLLIGGFTWVAAIHHLHLFRSGKGGVASGAWKQPGGSGNWSLLTCWFISATQIQFNTQQQHQPIDSTIYTLPVTTAIGVKRVITVSLTRTAQKLYVDGILAASHTTGWSTPDLPAWGDNGMNWFSNSDCAIQNIAIYDRVLDQDEIDEVMLAYDRNFTTYLLSAECGGVLLDGDSYWDDVIYLVNMDDTVGGTTFLDRSPRLHTMYVPTSGVVVDSTLLKGGNSGLFTPPAGTVSGAVVDGQRVSQLAVETWNGQPTDYADPNGITFEVSFYANAVPDSGYFWALMSERPLLATVDGILIYWASSGQIVAVGYNSSNVPAEKAFQLVSAPLNTGQKYDVSVTHDGGIGATGVWNLYIDGVVVDTDTQIFAVRNSVHTPTLGATVYQGNPMDKRYYFDGYIDEARITQRDRYGGVNYTPLTISFPVGSASYPSTIPAYIDTQIADPSPVTVEDGALAAFSIVITGDGGPFSVDWYETSAGLVAENEGTTYSFVADIADDGQEFYAVVYNALGVCGQSGTALLTVTAVDVTPRSLHTISWGLADGTPTPTVVRYQPISWGLAEGRADRSFECPIRTHRGLYDDGRTYWIPFYDKSARASRGPLTNDAYDRYYWTQDGQNMRYSPLANLELDTWTDGYDVGVFPPTTAPRVAAPASTSDEDLVVDRAYVYTFVTAWGEEGPPSPPTIASGVDSGVWEISSMDLWPEGTGRYNIIKKNIYRTISTNSTVDYHFVGSVLTTVADFTDAVATDEVGLNYVMESSAWYPPPDKLEGLLAHPNGFFVGFVGRDLHFSDPYRPHGWDPANVISTIGDIIGLGVFGTTLVVCTNSNPYTCTGIMPAAMTLSKHDTAEPCMSRYGIVSMPFGVYYPGPNGLMLSSGRGVDNATQQLMTKEEWRNLYQVQSFDAARYQSQYVAFFNQYQGLMFAPDEPIAALVNLDLRNARNGVQRQDSVFTDEYSGSTYILDGCEMYTWNPTAGSPLDYDWTSKEFDTPEPINFGAGRITWYSRYTPPTDAQTQIWRDWNTARTAAAPLNPLNFHALNVARQVDPVGYEGFIEMKQPFHWSPLVWVPFPGEIWPNTPYVILDIIANEQVIYSKQVTHTRMFRLPHGFKATRWYFRLRSNIPIQSAKFAETGKELASV